MKLLERGPKKRVESNEFETKRVIAGIMRDHIDLLPLNLPSLLEKFDAVVSDPGFIRQQSRFGEKISKSLFGTNDSGYITYIYDALDEAYIAHQVVRNQQRIYSDQPYIVHPIRVALLSIKLAQAMGVAVTPELISTALTHDVVEDSPKFQGKGRMYSQLNLASSFGSNSVFTGKRGKRLAANAYALSHHDVHEGSTGTVNEEKYYEKIIDGDKEARIYREIVKAADRIDNLLDPLSMPDKLYYQSVTGTLDDKLRIKQDRRVAISDKIIDFTALPRGLYNALPGTLAEKLYFNRIKYIDETGHDESVINRLFRDGTFLRSAVYKAVDISQQTIYDPYFTVDSLCQQLSDERFN